MKNNRTENKKIQLAFTIVILVFCEWFFFRNILGNNALIGDRADGRLTTLLTEHWWQFLCGNESFSELSMFYPAEGVMGYTDMFLGYGIIYSFFRFIHFDVFTSYKITLIVVHCIGTIAMYYLLKRKLHISCIWSLFGTMAFSFSDTFARHAAHTQLIAVSILPVLLIFFIGFFENYTHRKKRNIYAYLFIFWFVLLTYNSWYVAYFVGMFSLIFLIVYFILLKKNHIKICPLLRTHLKILGRDWIGYLAFLIILFIPFVMIYIPVLKMSSGYSYDSVWVFLPEITDLINVSESNFMLGWFISLIKLSERGYSYEVTEGFSLVVICLFMILFFINKHNENKYPTHTQKSPMLYENIYKELVINAVFITIITCIALILRLSSNGVSLWFFIYKLFPMAKSIRAVARFLLWLTFPIAIIIAYFADQWISKKSYGNIISISLVILLFVSNINIYGVYTQWNSAEETEFIKNVTPPPEDAEIFYIVDTAKSGDEWFFYQLDAFEIATYYSLKTINGYSGQFPIGWNNFNVCGEDYEDNIRNWITANQLQKVI